MSAPGLILPRFYANDIVNGARIDEHAKVIADAVNGGLTSKNLSSSVSLGNSYFAENSCIFTISNTTNYSVTSNLYPVGTTPVTSRLMGFGAIAMAAISGTASTTVQWRVIIWANAITVVDVTTPTTILALKKFGDGVPSPDDGGVCVIRFPLYQTGTFAAGTQWGVTLAATDSSTAIKTYRTYIAMTFAEAFQ